MGEILGIAVSGLNASQRALDTISHNIANTNTPGYSRETTLLASRVEVNFNYEFVGSGVTVLGVEREINPFLIKSLNIQQASTSGFEAFHNIAQLVDEIISDPSSNVSNALSGFFDALNELSISPDLISSRQSLLTQGQLLQNKFNGLYDQLQLQFDGIQSQLIQITSEINSLGEQIAALNVKIAHHTERLAYTDLPNDLLDRRDQLLRDLSRYVSVSTFIQDNGAMNVFIGSGQPLVMNTYASTLSTQSNDIDPMKTDIVLVDNFSSQIITNSMRGGAIGGLLSVQDDLLLPTMNALGRIAISVASIFNEQHKKGIDLNGNLGQDMFNDPNEWMRCLSRVTKDTHNYGNAIFSVMIDPFVIPQSPTTLISQGSAVVNAGTLTPLIKGMLTINNIPISPTTAADDPVSSSDNAASAIAIAKAINEKSPAHGVVASVEQNVAVLGAFTVGDLTAGNLRINGIDIIGTIANEAELLTAINTHTQNTGVVAVGNAATITLVAVDGRNIQLETDGLAAAATFTYFDTNGGVALDKVQRASVSLFSEATSVLIGGSNPAGVGFLSGTTPLQYTSLTTQDYLLTYDGTFYSLKDANTFSFVAQSQIPAFNVDGFMLKLESGKMEKGDSFLVTPTRNGAQDFSFVISDSAQVALGLPVRVEGGIENKGSGHIALTSVIDIQNPSFIQKDLLTPPFKIEFISATTYRVIDLNSLQQIGPDQIYDPLQVNDIFPITGVVVNGSNQTIIYDPGYRVSLQGQIQTGDVFTITYNSNAQGDNRNADLMLAFQMEKLMINQSSTFQDAYAQLIGSVATQTQQAGASEAAGFSLLQYIQSERDSFSGVNLDEEAANLLRFQQQYQACAQVILTARNMFDIITFLFR